MDRQKEFVLRTLEERDIRFVRLWFTDVLGYLKSVAIAPAELEGAFEEGIGFDGSSIEGFARVSEADMVARPDPSTFQVLPWTTSAARTIRRGCSATSRRSLATDCYRTAVGVSSPASISTKGAAMSVVRERLRELRLPRAERMAARAERRAEDELRRERDNQHRVERRAAAVEAEARRYSNPGMPGAPPL